MRTNDVLLFTALLVILVCLSSFIVQAQMQSANTTHGTMSITIVNALKEGTALHVLVANNWITTVDLTNWKLVTDNNNSTFIFPAFKLKPNTIVTVHTHKGNNTATDLYGSNFIWNGTHDIKLFTNNGMLVYDYHIFTQAACQN